MKYIWLSALSLLTLFSCVSTDQTQEDYASKVNVFIGTGGHGHTFPGAAFPYGQIQLSPDNVTGGWDWCSGYHDSDSTVVGFSHLHLSGTGIGDLYDISVLPTIKKVEYREGDDNAAFISNYIGTYDKEDEKASPGYYGVRFNNSGIKAELTTTKRVGVHRYSFPKHQGNNTIIFNLGYAKNWDATVKTAITEESPTQISGYRWSTGWAKDQRVYFVAQFSAPIIAKQVFETGDNQAVGAFEFKQSEVVVKVGISSVSKMNAEENITTDNATFNFEETQKFTHEQWNKSLSKIHINGASANTDTIFYTALYHTMIAPALFSDQNGQYKAPNGQNKVAEGYNRYTVFSLWDTYRSLHPLMTITDEKRVNDMVRSLLDHYETMGFLPVWELEGNDNGCMVGNHAISVIAEAIMKDIGDFDREEAYQAMKKSSLIDRRGMGYHNKIGYIPSDKENEAVAKSLEYSVDDWAVAAVAKKLGYKEDYQYFIKRANNFENYFNKETGFFRGKNADGSWVTPFVPTESRHRDNDYTEGTAWQYLWLVPQNPQKLISLLGGEKPFVEKLDTFFSLKEGITGEHASPDISGLIGGYAHGNEPGHHTIYLYNIANRPDKTQSLIHKVINEMYHNNPDGISGNEDCGQMSAWYILSSIGIYPMNPASGQYQLGAPNVPEITINLTNHKTFNVVADNFGNNNIYVDHVELNGKRLNRSFITHKEIKKGGELKFYMSSVPSNTFKKLENNN
ncbi:GH92 family glycosyl hydrolase [Halosquirtibacter xylanolyticus]|uniref:GH92 family glycosyl hydrolase n=1 Tax=Halosquirtibacter xylanolyticus TaxID=3374599 RepID=UPI0037497CD2|nr:GH92 family glycosyl hydrolase [Prolixibacteraceae bacterium]